MELGKKIKQLRFKSALTQEQLAQKLGIGPQSISKWENAVAMPDISTLPLLAEIFGVTIDDLFDLTASQRLNRIENRMEVEEELPRDVFYEYEEFLKTQLSDEQQKERATALIANLYWHRMNTYAQKVRRYAKDAVRMSPNEKGCQWLLQMAEGHTTWDWNVANHTAAIEFYSELVKANPDSVLSYECLLDNLIADHRADEAEKVLNRLCALKGFKPFLAFVYRAHIALARFDAASADRIIEDMVETYAHDTGCLFEAAQYYAKKCDYEIAISYYERDFECDSRRPRFMDALQGIAEIYQIMGNYRMAAQTYDRIIDLLENEWGLTEEIELKQAQNEKARLLAKT
ncbi:MAG: helix-turn-helix transcriptional regulator [Ruminococcaceae bacterium]|nr:helix-turn-helix transcriptional regulator [Oscillospiraceae bacterium]